MSKTRMFPIYGRVPACYMRKRLEERRNKLRALKLEQNRKPDKTEDFIAYDDSDSEEETPTAQNEILKTSYNFVDYVRNREMLGKNIRYISSDYGPRHILTHEMFKETPISLGNLNKVYCSQWLSDRQVVFGTKCNKLMVYDVVTNSLDRIPCLVSKRKESGGAASAAAAAAAAVGDGPPRGIHSVKINPSKTLLATGAKSTNDIAVYRLPTLDPVCVGENGHSDAVYSMCWLDDEFLASGSLDSKMSLWRITQELCDSVQDVPRYHHINAVCVKDSRNAQNVRAVEFNKAYQEIASLSLNGYIHIWSADTFKQKLSRKMPSSQDNVCLAVQESGLYAIGCKSYTLLLDCRTLQAVKKISSRYSGCGIRSLSFQGDVLTIGTGLGMLMFYDLKAGKYLDSSINSSRTVVLKASKGFVCPDDEFVDNAQNVKYVPAIYTHCYDSSGTRLFTAGGPLPSSLNGNYAGLWR